VADDSAVRNRSETVTVQTPRGAVEVVRQEMRGLQRGSGWTWFWIARRRGQSDWRQASTAREAIRRATLIAPRKPPRWLAEATGSAERQIVVDTDRESTASPDTDETAPTLNDQRE
jgi:hypothetical protein